MLLNNKPTHINIRDIFNLRKSCVDNILKKKVDLPNQIFKKKYKYFKFLDFDEIFSKDFYYYFSNYVKGLGINYFTYYTLKPDPEDYFFKFFKKFSVIDFNINDEHEFFLSRLHDSPDEELNSPDALIFNSSKVLLFCENLDLFIYGNRDEELAIVVSSNRNVFETFVNEYPNDSFCNVEEYVEHLLGLKFNSINFEEEDFSFYGKLITNYENSF